MDRKELIVVLLLAILVALLATVRLFHGPTSSSYTLEREPPPPRRTDGRDGTSPSSPAADLAKRLPPFPIERYTPRDPDTRSLFEAAERVFLQALIQVATEPSASAPFLETAITTYQNFRSRYPNEPAAEVALLRVAQCYTVLKRFPEAARAFDRFLEIYPKSELSPMALLWSGENHLKEGKAETAKARLDEVITQYPASPFVEGALLRVAQCYAAMKSFTEASHAYDRFLAAYPKSELRPVALLGSSDSHLKEGDTAAARARLEEVIRDNPSSPFAEAAQQRLGQLKAPPPPK